MSEPAFQSPPRKQGSLSKARRASKGLSKAAPAREYFQSPPRKQGSLSKAAQAREYFQSPPRKQGSGCYSLHRVLLPQSEKIKSREQ
jgi:hypothetical protein